MSYRGFYPHLSSFFEIFNVLQKLVITITSFIPLHLSILFFHFLNLVVGVKFLSIQTLKFSVLLFFNGTYLSISFFCLIFLCFNPYFTFLFLYDSFILLPFFYFSFLSLYVFFDIFFSSLLSFRSSIA